ncbi:MAG: murein biosynthesis integral membrane protein MurJ [Ardenticatenia bacterium]|nr:murein biosynthesis integral membrane protein MurJ [Ardenticatenia bacterium]
MTVETSSLNQVEEHGHLVPQRRHIARAAGLISLGNVASRVLGLVRETVFANQFGSSGAYSAFVAASAIPMMVYDMLIGGLLSSALVPVFSEHRERRAELWRLASVVLSATAAVVALLVVFVELTAPWLAALLVSGFEPELQGLTGRLIRLVTPAVMLLSVSGVLTGLLYALRRFTFAAFGAAIYNLGLIVGAVFFSRLFVGPERIYGLALGMLAGALGQVLILMPELRDQRLMLIFDWRHPALRRIVRLYVPVALGFLVSHVGIVIDRSLASTTGEQSIGWMRYATTLIQFPLGLVATAVSLAVLPNLSHLAAQEARDGYLQTLRTGIRMVIVLIVPAAVGLFVLATPIVALLFEHGEFTAFDTLWTARALRLYLIGLIFAAVDQVLVFGYYARQNTLVPAAVGAVAVGIYLAVALPLVQMLGMLALVLANSVQWVGHALIMLWFTRRAVGAQVIEGVVSMAGRTAVASLCMGVVVAATLVWLEGLAVAGLGGRLVVVAVPAFVGMGVYALMAALLGLEEIRAAAQLVIGRLRQQHMG